METNRNLTQTKQVNNLLNIAQIAINDYMRGDLEDETSQYRKAIKAKKKYIKHRKSYRKEWRDIDCGEQIRDFAIPLNKIPKHLLTLMYKMKWLNDDTQRPLKGLDDFYRGEWHDDNLDTTITWYIGIDAYIELLQTEYELRYLLKKQAVQAVQS